MCYPVCTKGVKIETSPPEQYLYQSVYVQPRGGKMAQGTAWQSIVQHPLIMYGLIEPVSEIQEYWFARVE